jgi:hypothetical protein
MNAGYISAFAALAGSLIGGLTTFAAARVTQRQQANVQWLLQEKTRRQELEEASKLYVDALIHDQAEIPPLVSLYALINKMRVVSNPRHCRTGRQGRSKIPLQVKVRFSPFRKSHKIRSLGLAGNGEVTKN